jgi:hypothetical protein
MKKQHRITSILSSTLIAGLFFSPAVLAQQNNSQPQPQQQNQPAAQPQTAPANTQPTAPANTDQQTQSQPQQTNPSGTSVNPSQAPLQPVTTYPDASGQQQQEQPIVNTAPAQSNLPEGPQPKKQSTEPVGAASAESVPTAGGAAAKPAGVAIAPAKQHQTRSLMIKVGAALAAGAALGTVFALSHGTSSTPPGTGLAGATPK